jgi:hypothetical protein
MRYKAIAAGIGAASLLAMGIPAAEESAKSSYSFEGLARLSRRDRTRPPWLASRLCLPSRQHHPVDSPARADVSRHLIHHRLD